MARAPSRRAVDRSFECNRDHLRVNIKVTLDRSRGMIRATMALQSPCSHRVKLLEWWLKVNNRQNPLGCGKSKTLRSTGACEDPSGCDGEAARGALARRA